MESPAADLPHVGVFDSGIGGLSILRELRRALPGVTLSYLADNRHLPYGDKSTAWLNTRVQTLVAQLLAQGAVLVVVACNTATTHTIAGLRQRWPDVAFVGVEPGIKPAVQASREGRIGVLATPATMRSPRLQQLITQHAGDCRIELLPCAELATAIEQGNDGRIDALVEEACADLRAAGVDTVVLGCTHYPLVSERWSSRLGPEIHIVDTATAVARRVASLLTQCADRNAGMTALATGELQPVERALKRWLSEPVTLRGCSW